MGGGVLRGAVAAVLGALCAVSGAAATAYAHTELDNAVPAADVRVEKTPGSVQLNFTEPVDADLASVVVRGPNGQDLAAGPVRQSGPGVIQPITAAPRPGTVEVAYRVVSLDGHPVSGSYTFEVLRGDPDAAQAPGGGPLGPERTGSGAADGSLTAPVLAAGVVLLVVAAGAVVARRRARTARPQTTPPIP
ncbi:MAG: copper resistance protein CopC [Actinomycetota bacterium]|nr:copper resistance protein CopC [Actinomycetota bacterium]